MKNCKHSWKHLAGNSSRELFWCRSCGALRLSGSSSSEQSLKLEIEESGEFILLPKNSDPNGSSFTPSINLTRK